MPELPAELKAVLETTPVSQIEYHEEIDSTNSRALELAEADQELQTPLLVIADRQTAGRGRGSNQWFSTSGSLTFTFLYAGPEVPFPREQWSRVSLATALGVRDVIADAVSTNVQVKWPNDVYLAGRKVAGILLESVADRLAIGVGVNVNNSFATAPRDVQTTAISIADAARQAIDMPAFLAELITAIDTAMRHLNEFPGAQIELWNRHCYLLGKQVRVDRTGDSISGTVEGINEECELELHTATGHVAVNSGMVTII